MTRHRTVLGNNQVVFTQQAIVQAMTSLKRNAMPHPRTIYYANRCIGCDTERHRETDNIIRCAMLSDRFAWLCSECTEHHEVKHR